MEKLVGNSPSLFQNRIPGVPTDISIPTRGCPVENPVFLPRMGCVVPSCRTRPRLDPTPRVRPPQPRPTPPHLVPSPGSPEPAAQKAERSSIHSVHNTDDDDEEQHMEDPRIHWPDHCGSPLAPGAPLLPDCAPITKEGS